MNLADVSIRPVACLCTSESLTAVPSTRPDIVIIHARKADAKGNVLIEGLLGFQKGSTLAAKRLIVTVNAVVAAPTPASNACVRPYKSVAVPGGAYLSYAHGYSGRSDAFHLARDAIARDRASLDTWTEQDIFQRAPEDFVRFGSK